MQETINYKRPTYSSAYTQGCQTSQINGRFSYEYFTSHRSHESHKGTRAIACVRLRDVSLGNADKLQAFLAMQPFS